MQQPPRQQLLRHLLAQDMVTETSENYKFEKDGKLTPKTPLDFKIGFVASSSSSLSSISIEYLLQIKTVIENTKISYSSSSSSPGGGELPSSL